MQRSGGLLIQLTSLMRIMSVPWVQHVCNRILMIYIISIWVHNHSLKCNIHVLNQPFCIHKNWKMLTHPYAVWECFRADLVPSVCICIHEQPLATTCIHLQPSNITCLKHMFTSIGFLSQQDTVEWWKRVQIKQKLGTYTYRLLVQISFPQMILRKLSMVETHNVFVIVTDTLKSQFITNRWVITLREFETITRSEARLALKYRVSITESKYQKKSFKLKIRQGKLNILQTNYSSPNLFTRHASIHRSFRCSPFLLRAVPSEVSHLSTVKASALPLSAILV